MRSQHSLYALIPFVLAGCATYNEPSIKEIPAQYHGQWVVDKSTCNVEGLGHDGDIYITATEVSFHAEPYRVKTIRKLDAGYAVTYTPPDQQYMDPPAKLFLSDDGETLSGLWQRCAKPANQ